MQSLKKNYIYYLLYQLLILLTPFITTPYVSRILGPDGIGSYGFALSIVSYFTTFGVLGMSGYGLYKASVIKDNQTELNAFFSKIMVARGLLCGLSLLIYFILILLIPGDWYMYLILSISILAAMIDVTWLLQSLERIKETVLRNSIIKLLGIACIFIFVLDQSDIYHYALILQLSLFLANIMLFIQVLNYVSFVRIDFREIPDVLRSSLLYFIPTVAETIYFMFGRTMLGFVTVDDIENGYLEQSLKIVTICLALTTSVNAVILPRIANENNRGDNLGVRRNQIKSLSCTALISIPIMFGLFILSYGITRVFLGEKFIYSSLLLKVLVFYFLFASFRSNIGNTYLIACGKQLVYNRILILGVIVCTILNILLIPGYLSLGACVSTSIAELVMIAYTLFVVRNSLSLRDILINTWKIILSAFVMLGYITLVDSFYNLNSVSTLFLVIITAALVYSVLLYLLKETLFMNTFKGLTEKFKLFS